MQDSPQQTDTKPALVDVCEVGFRAGGRLILDSVSWRINRSEHWAVLGPNGAGKTTLLKMICGYLWPNAGGSIYRNGSRLQDLRQLRKSIGWVSVALVSRIPPEETAINTVVSGRFGQIGLRPFRGFGAAEQDFAAAEQYMRLMDCEHVGRQQFGTLSQGEKQKVLICRAQMAEPMLMVLDEPCAGLDPGARERLLEAIDRLADRHPRMGLIFVTQHVEEILPLFENLLTIADGRVVQVGATADILGPALIERLYGIKAEIIPRNGRFLIAPLGADSRE